MKNDDYDIFPGDYEACGDCGFDHGYEQAAAIAWHEKNDRSAHIEPQLQEHSPEVIRRIMGG